MVSKLLYSISLIFLFINLSYGEELPPIKIKYSSYAVADDGKVLGYFGEQRRVEVKSLHDISKYVIEALIATEDRDFYNHDGVSVKGLARALWKTLTGSTQGGSTLTMQLARNLFLTNEQTLSRKFSEINLAKELEKKFTKNQILLMYLNVMYFGNGAYGIWVASQEYFSSTPNKLSLLESATLIGLLKSPNGYNPIKYPDKALERRNEVLHNLVEVGHLSQSEFNRLKSKPLGLKPSPHIGQHFLEYIRREASQILIPYGIHLSTDVVKITTTLNFNYQMAVEKVVKDQWANFPQPMKDAQVGLVSLEVGSGKILTMLGGNEQSSPRGLNRATQIHRQVGSTFKPFLYGKMLEDGYTLATPLLDSAIIVDSGKSWQWIPSNDDGTYSSMLVSMQKAIQNSINLCAVYAIENLIDIDSVISFAHRCGIKSEIERFPSISLGAVELSPIELASAYSVFAAFGKYFEPFGIIKIEDANGKIIYSYKSEEVTVIDSSIAYLMTYALKSPIENGTASSVRSFFNLPAYGKTGTTQNHTDTWFVGFNPKVCTAIWVGFDVANQKLSGAYRYGGTVCAPLWGKLMSKMSKYENFTKDFIPPSTINFVELCEDSGLLSDSNCVRKKPYPIDITKDIEICKIHY